MTTPRALTETDQANLALAKIGEPRIASLDDTKRKSARECKQNFAAVRDVLLRKADWQFARQSVTPAPTATPPDTAYAYRYLMPVDCLAVRELRNVVDDEWETSAPADNAALIVLDTSVISPFVWYTRRVENPALWDALFAEVFQLLLAAAINPAIGRDKALTSALLQQAQNELRDSEKRDAQTRSSQSVTRDTSWVAARGGFTSFSRGRPYVVR